MYASTLNSINFDWYLIFHIYMCVCFDCDYYIFISLSTNFSYAKLDLVLNDNYLNWYLIQAYASFCLVFHKEGENSYFYLSIGFVYN